MKYKYKVYDSTIKEKKIKPLTFKPRHFHLPGNKAVYMYAWLHLLILENAQSDLMLIHWGNTYVAQAS